MAIYDCCLFFNENDIFEIRLNQHWDFVDRFIVVEAGETHTGLKKPLNFDHERFRPYASKIEYRSFDSFDEAIKNNPEYYDALDDQIHDFKPEWRRDDFQGNYCFKVLNEIGAKDDDIVLLSPPDEIVKQSAMLEAVERFKDPAVYDITDASERVSVKASRPIFHVMMPLYIYKFNLITTDTPTRPFASISEFGNYRKIFPSLARNVGLVTHPAIENGGWHFSYHDSTDGERVLEKMKSWAHATDSGRGLNGARRMDAATPSEAIQILINEFNMKIVPVARDTHPDYIVDNQEQFSNFIINQ